MWKRIGLRFYCFIHVCFNYLFS